MKLNKYILILVLILLLAGVYYVNATYNARKTPNDYTLLYEFLQENCETSTDCHLIIYIDINACLTCNEDMNAWRELERILLNSNCMMSIWAPQTDSQDVAVAMQLEGINTPIQVLRKEYINFLGWDNKQTPIKVLFDKCGQPVFVYGACQNKEQSREAINKILAKLNQIK